MFKENWRLPRRRRCRRQILGRMPPPANIGSAPRSSGTCTAEVGERGCSYISRTMMGRRYHPEWNWTP